MLQGIIREILEEIRKYMRMDREYGEIVGYKHEDSIRKIDLEVERMLEDSLKRREICARIISEEKGDRILGEGKLAGTFIFDPIDGSTNISRGIPFFCSSLAWSPKMKNITFGDIEEGAVAYIPENRIFFAKRGEGAFLDGRRIKVSSRKKPVISLSAYKAFIPKSLLHIQSRYIIRTFGAAALELCFVASGRLDAMIDIRGFLRGFDVAAGILIVREAGGICTDENGRELDKDVKSRGISVVAASKKRHEEIMEMLLRS
jgi:myo-inositol-1(or 4)-monophosphatase